MLLSLAVAADAGGDMMLELTVAAREMPRPRSAEQLELAPQTGITSVSILSSSTLWNARDDALRVGWGGIQLTET